MITAQQLRATEQFTSFTDADFEMLLGATTTRTFAPGECLFVQGRPATSCFIVASGVVEILRESDGETRLITRLSAGSIAGQLSLVEHEHAPRSATLRALTAVTALELQRDVFDMLLSASSPLAYHFQIEIAIATGRQLRDANRRLAALLDGEASHGRRDFEDDFEAPFVPIDVIEITPPERVGGLCAWQ
ncbi:MAG: cyclic nucleotide-binding domain-containing protein [Polyangiales bacterium]